MKRRSIGVIIALFLLVGIVGCGGGQIKEMSSTDLYYEALGYWYTTEQNFKLVYNSTTEEQQNEMKDFVKLLYDSKQVLNLWKLHADGSLPTTDDMAKWRELKNQLILYVLNEYKKKEG